MFLLIDINNLQNEGFSFHIYYVMEYILMEDHEDICK